MNIGQELIKLDFFAFHLASHISHYMGDADSIPWQRMVQDFSSSIFSWCNMHTSNHLLTCSSYVTMTLLSNLPLHGIMVGRWKATFFDPSPHSPPTLSRNILVFKQIAAMSMPQGGHWMTPNCQHSRLHITIQLYGNQRHECMFSSWGGTLRYPWVKMGTWVSSWLASSPQHVIKVCHFHPENIEKRLNLAQRRCMNLGDHICAPGISITVIFWGSFLVTLSDHTVLRAVALEPVPFFLRSMPNYFRSPFSFLYS